MAFSGTVSQTTFDKRKIIERAYARCRIPQQQIVNEMVQDASEELYLMLSDWANQQIPLWTVERVILPLYEGVGELPAGVGTNDVLAVNLRTLTQVTGTNTDDSTSRSTLFTDTGGNPTPIVVSTVGVKWNAAPPTTLTFARSADGVTWTTVATHTVLEGSGEWTWVDMPSFVAAEYFRVTGSSATGFSQMFYGNSPQETPMGVWNRNDWFQTTTKGSATNRPLNYWFERKVPEPSVYVWPTPNDDAETSQAIVQRQRYIMDVGTMVQEIEVPQRWLDAVVGGLAARLALMTPEVPTEMIPILDIKAMEALRKAQQEEYEGGPFRITPDISGYTR